MSRISNPLLLRGMEFGFVEDAWELVVDFVEFCSMPRVYLDSRDASRLR